SINQQPATTLPYPLALFGRIAGERIIQSVRALHDKQTLRHVVTIASCVVLYLSIDIEWADADGRGLAFVGPNKNLNTLRFAEQNDVRLGCAPCGRCTGKRQQKGRERRGSAHYLNAKARFGNAASDFSNEP